MLVGCRVVAVGMVAVVVAICGCDGGAQRVAESPTHEQYSARLAAVGVATTLLGREWLAAATAALTAPLPVTPPYSHAGGFVGHEADAIGLAFTGIAGQTLTVTLTLSAPQSSADAGSVGRIYAEVFRVVPPADHARHVWLAALPAGEGQLAVELPEDATYVVRVQPQLLVDARYQLALELDAVLPFPVSGFHTDVVGSFFGNERDAGARHHEGVDIFAPRSTPVLAVAAGRATARVNKLGGNTVWLSTAGKSYYYAHLERQAITGTQWVSEGDVLGFVGNTGNAVTTPPHLHFGVYQWGSGAIDPLPLLGSAHFASELRIANFALHYVKTQGTQLNFRRGPSARSKIISQLPAATVLAASAASGDWLRVRLPEPGAEWGWIHSRYQTPLAKPLRGWRADGAGFLFAATCAGGAPVQFVAPNTELEVLAQVTGCLLLRDPRTGRQGWIAAAPEVF